MTMLAIVGVVLAQSDTSINLVDFAFGLGLWHRLPASSSASPGGIVKAMSLCLQRISQSAVNGQDMVDLLQAVKANTTVAASVGPFEQDTVNLLVGERQRLMEAVTDDEVKQADASNLDSQIDFFKGKPTLVILQSSSSSDQPSSSGGMDWQKWTDTYAKCVDLVKADSNAVDGVRIYMAGWLDVGGDPPQTEILNTTTSSTTASSQATAASSISLEGTADDGSPKPPDLHDLLEKMRQELGGSGKSSTNANSSDSSDDEDESNGSACTSRANAAVLIAGVAVVLAL